MRIASRPLLLWISAASASSYSTARSLGGWVLQDHVQRNHQSLSLSSLSSSSIPTAFVKQSSSLASRSKLALRQKLQNQLLRSFRTTTTTTSTRSLQQATSMSAETETIKQTLRVALCQFHVTSDKQENQNTATKFLAQAAEQGAELVVLPEIWNSPYATAAFPEYAETLPTIGDSEATHSASSQTLINAAKQHKFWVVGGSIPESVATSNEEPKIYNTCLVIDPDGKIVAKHRKVHLFDIDVPGGITFFESETLTAGETISHFTSPVGEIGVGICYDIRFAEYAMVLRQQYNCSILIYPGAFNMTTGPAHWELLQRARAIDNQCFVVTASPARTVLTEEEQEKLKYPHYTAWGHSTVVSPWGDILATTDEKEGLVVVDLDLSKVNQVRGGIPISIQKRSDLYTLKEA